MKSSIVTQKDIAEALGTSVNTVSHALRNLDDISFEMKEKIKRKADEMGYVPNSMAVNLKTGSTKTIALIYDNLLNPYFTIMASKILELIKVKGYDTIIFPCENYFEIKTDTLTELIKLHVDGVLSFLDLSDEAMSSKIINAFPIVVVGRQSNHKITSIYTDDYQGGKMIGLLFKEKGYKKILYAGPEMINESSRRFNGIKEVYGNDIIKFQYREQDNIDLLFSKISQEKVEAVFAFNDVLATLIKTEIDKRCLHIDVAGYDYIHGQLPFVNEMNSIQYDFNEIADLSVKSLFEIIENSKSEIKKIQMPVTLHRKGD